MPHSVASDLGLHSLTFTLLGSPDYNGLTSHKLGQANRLTNEYDDSYISLSNFICHLWGINKNEIFLNTVC